MALIPDISAKYNSLFQQFLAQPGVIEQLIQDLELIKQRKYSELSTGIQHQPKSPSVDNTRILPPISPRSPRPPLIENSSPRKSQIENNESVEESSRTERLRDEILLIEEEVDCTSEANPETNLSISASEAGPNERVPEPKCDIPCFYKRHVFTPVLPTDFITSVQQFFNCQPNGQVTVETAGRLALLCGLPFYLRTPLFTSISKQKKGTINCQEFLSFWQTKANLCLNVSPTKKMFSVLTRFEERKFVTPSDLHAVIEDVLMSHPGLGFFRDDNDPVLFTAYITVVTSSIFYAASGWRRRRISEYQAEKVGLVDVFAKVRAKLDVNEVEHFSYDQFYVVYVKFAEIDSNNDMELDYKELMEHFGGEGLSNLAMARILEVNRTRRETQNMRLEDFVVLLMAEVDKTTPEAIEYWFRVLDLDCDGYLSLHELHTFFEVNNGILLTLDLLQQFGVQFEDIACQLFDSVSGKSNNASCFTLLDLKKNPRFPHLVNAFINIFKFISEDENSECCIKSKLTAWQNYVHVQAMEMQAGEL